nr:immunoglobulin heavy chain junction region [Macaca mulatta]MOW23209.1 immunoglobulin heavy chain junction region [Macaca mulatta]MOW23256.1 immunoglobulin heavy chain junction region [Macaca mulatta]MOW23349.1 immunoglobulin heavy chain junction region [Macaca mulatta]MOW23358.1 immunoglobulin heavy chain junction region [Macaca mulatta]
CARGKYWYFDIW